MHTKAQHSRGMLWTGVAVSTVIGLMLIADALGKILKAAAVMEGTVKVGYPAAVVPGIGIALLVSVLLYLLPRTSVLGAILLTGYLGGAVATNLRVQNPWLSYTLVPVYVGILLWGALFLRDERLRALIPTRKS